MRSGCFREGARVFRVCYRLSSSPVERRRRRAARTGPNRPAPPQANQLHRHAEFALHVKDNAALGCSIKFGKCHPGDVYHVSEHPSLRQPVLSDGRVNTSSTSSTSARRSTTRLILPSSSMRPVLVCNRPAVSTTTTSAPSRIPASTASKATEAGRHPRRPEPPAHRRAAPRPGADRRRRHGTCPPRPVPPGARRRQAHAPACRPWWSCRCRSHRR